MGELAGKTAVVLGASRPYGAATARALAREGTNLVLGGRNRQRLEALEKESEEYEGQVIAFGTHLAKRHHPAHLIETAASQFGSLDMLLYMAGAGAAPLGSLDIDSWERSVDVNIKGFLYCVAAALPFMRKQRGGHVLSLSIEATEPPDPLRTASQLSQHTLLQALGQEFWDENIYASEILLSGQEVSPEECTQTILRLLSGAREREGGFSTHRL